jgi:hypothetical protein
LWADHRVAPCATAVYDLRHPLVGDLTVTQQTLRSIDKPEQTLVTCTAPAGSPSAAALVMLGQVTMTPRPSASGLSSHHIDRHPASAAG